MKKLAMLLMLITAVPFINVAQPEGKAPVESFKTCLVATGMNCNVTKIGNSAFTLNGYGKINGDLIKGCIAEYDNSRINSPESPAIFLFSGNTTISGKKSTQNN